jgi:5-methylcytosine-specific restriction endonuclease McrA
MGPRVDFRDSRHGLSRRPHLLKSYSRAYRSLYGTHGGTCLYGKQVFPPEQLTLEHLVPRSLGGTNALDNLRLACFNCNNRRGAVLIR